MTAGTTRDPATVGPYRLVRKLGEGGMGVVHLATDPAGRSVALKVLRAHVANDDEARRRLSREVDTLRRVRHPLVAEVLDADVAGAEPYLVTRYVPGRSLEEEVRASGPMPAAQVARMGRALAGALAAIHAAGVVHRDVKPANVMLVGADPVLIDFGIAHVADESRITRTGLVMGTPGYLSPELIYGGAVTQATDWWAWGATLAFAATGRQPFGNGPIEVILERVRRGQSDLDGVEDGLRAVIAMTLIADSDTRPAAPVLLARLERVIAGVPTAPSAVDEWGRATSGPEAPTTRTPPPVRTPPARTTVQPPVDRTKRMSTPSSSVPPSAASSAASSAAGIPPYPGAPQPPRSGQPSWSQNPQPPQPPQPGAAYGPAPRYGTPQYGSPQYGSPQYGSPQYGSPQYGSPQYGSPQYGSPQYAAPYPAPPAPAPPPPPPPAHGPQPWHDPAGQPTAGSPLDPSIRVTGTLAAVAVALAAVAAVAPGGAIVIVFLLTVIARLVQRSSAGLQRRREELGGPRATDVALTVAALPWRLVMSLVMSLITLLLPVLVATSTAFIVGVAASTDGAPHPNSPVALFAGLLAGAATGWWGPGGWSLRTGSRAVVRAVTRGRAGRIALISFCALLVVAAAMVASGGGYAPDWAPFAAPEQVWG